MNEKKLLNNVLYAYFLKCKVHKILKTIILNANLLIRCLLKNHFAKTLIFSYLKFLVPLSIKTCYLKIIFFVPSVCMVYERQFF